jgi:hypothetical protein
MASAIGSSHRDQLELDVVGVPAHQGGEDYWFFDVADAAVLDTYGAEMFRPPLELSPIGHVEPDVVEPGATLIELLTLIACVLVQADKEARS